MLRNSRLNSAFNRAFDDCFFISGESSKFNASIKPEVTAYGCDWGIRIFAALALKMKLIAHPLRLQCG
jgi:hypothetical protein